MMPTDYVLDGQQRLTVVYSSIGASDDAAGFAPGYDLVSEEFISMDETTELSPAVFPLRWIYDTTKMLNFRTGLMSRQDSAALQPSLDGIVDLSTKYRIPVVTLKDLTIEEVCPSSSESNSSGTKLSIYDLMVAQWSEKFDLNHHVEVIADSLKTKSFHKIEKDTVLKCLSAVQFGSMKQDTNYWPARD